MTEKDWLDTWNLFDDKQKGYVSALDFRHIARSLGRRCTEVEFDDAIKDLGDPVALSKFIEFMRKPYNGPTEKDLFTALQAFDTSDQGKVKVTELITLLTSLGERMSESEVRQLLAELKTDREGCVGIDDFVKFLTSPIPSITNDIIELQEQFSKA